MARSRFAELNEQRRDEPPVTEKSDAPIEDKDKTESLRTDDIEESEDPVLLEGLRWRKLAIQRGDNESVLSASHDKTMRENEYD